MPARHLFFYLLLFFGFTSCKKDLLHFKNVVKLDSHTTGDIHRVLFVNDSLCVTAGGNRFYSTEVLRSTDGGHTWQAFSFPEVGVGLYGVAASPDGTLYMCGNYAHMLRSVDGGISWGYRQMPDYKFYTGVAFPTNERGIYINTQAQDSGEIVTMDSNYVVLNKKAYNFGLNDIQMANEHTGFITGLGTVLKTTDGGLTWNYTDIKNDNFKAIYCRDENHAWVCGYAGSIFKTTDGGNSWQRLRNGNDITLSRYWLNDILFTDDQHGFAVGDYGLVIYTDDGGTHWMEFDRFTSEHLNAVAKCPDGDLLVAGDKGTLYRLKTGNNEL